MSNTKHLQRSPQGYPICGAERSKNELGYYDYHCYGSALSTIDCKDCARIEISNHLKKIVDVECRLGISRHDPVPTVKAAPVGRPVNQAAEVNANGN